MPPIDNDDTLPPLVGDVQRPGGPEELPPGTRAGDYVIHELIGRGGTGLVYLAEHATTHSRAAVKVLNRELALRPEGVERFLREVRSIDRIKHPNIIDIYDLGRLPDERPWFAMELLEGNDLRRHLVVEGHLTPTDSFAIISAICGALEAAHGMGIVHRDVKAENVMMCRDGRIKLVDFGIAKLLAQDPATPGLTSTGQFLGTPVAMAPEQIRCAAIDARTDVYGLGVLVYNILTGMVPFRGGWEVVVTMHLTSPPRPPSTLVPLSPQIDAVVLRMLEKEPAARFQSVAAFLEAYRAAVFGETAARHGHTGIGLLVRAAPAGDADDDALADAAMALDAAETELQAKGYQIAVHTPSEILGVLLTPEGAGEALAAMSRAVATAEQIHASLADLPAGVQVSVTVHSDEAEVRAGGTEIVGGPLLKIGAWRADQSGIVVTPRARAAMTT